MNVQIDLNSNTAKRQSDLQGHLVLVMTDSRSYCTSVLWRTWESRTMQISGGEREHVQKKVREVHCKAKVTFLGRIYAEKRDGECMQKKGRI